MRTLIYTNALLFVLFAAPAAAQEPRTGTVELGGFGQYTNFDADAGCPCEWPMDGLGIGARAGVFLNSLLGVELDAATMNAERALVGGNMRYTAVAARMNLNARATPLSESLWLTAGVGPVWTAYGDDGNWGASGLAGARWLLAPALAARVDGVADYMPGEENLNLIARAGLSVLLGVDRNSGMSAAPPPQPPPPPAQPATQSSPATAAAPAQAPPPAPAAPATEDAAAQAVLIAPIFFDFDQAVLRSDAIETLEAKANVLLARPSVRLVVEGNADDRGTAEYNVRLGLQRAETARDFLARRGVDSERIEVVSFGASRLFCTRSDDDESCHQQNRRVDFRILTFTSED